MSAKVSLWIARALLVIATLLVGYDGVLAQSTKAQLNTEIDTQFPDNAAGQITASRLRTVTKDMVNSVMPTAPVTDNGVAAFDGTTGLLKDAAAATVATSLSTPALIGTTSVTSPLVVGGSGVGSDLTFKTTTGVGSGDDFVWVGGNNGATERMRLTSTALNVGVNAVPASDDGAALGTTALQWSDLFIASGGVINWNNGNITLTHSAGLLTLGGGPFSVTNTTDSTSATTGAIVTAGGIGAAKSLVIGGNRSAFGTSSTSVNSIALFEDGTGKNQSLWRYTGKTGFSITQLSSGNVVYNLQDNANLGLYTNNGSGALLQLYAGGAVSVGASAVDKGANNFYVQGFSFAAQGLATTAPATKTGTSGTISDSEPSVIFNPSGAYTATLPTASSYSGKFIFVKTIAAQTVSSASSNIVPVAGGAAGTAILSATAGKWAILQSNGTAWEIMASN